MTDHQFEERRLALFKSHGFEGEGRWIADRHGRRVYMIERGESDCPTVLVHGGLSDAGEWFDVAGRLPGRVVIPDRPGCGLSYPIDYRKVEDYSRSAREWFKDLVDGLGVERVDIIANSMGGYFATALASAYPERVCKLIFVGAPAGMDRPIPLFLRMWGNPLVGPFVGRMVLRMKTGEQVRKRVFPMLSAHPERISAEFLECALASQKLPGAELAARTMLRTVLTMRGWRGSMMTREALAAVETPTHFIWGDRDAFAPPSSGHDMVRRMRNASIDVLPDTGHLPHLDEPVMVAQTITRFLADNATLRVAN